MNSEVGARVIRRGDFLREGEMANPAFSKHLFRQLRVGGAKWLEMSADIRQKLVVPAHIVSAQLHPHVVLWSNLEKVVFYRADGLLEG